MSSTHLFSESAEQNKEPILQVILKHLLPFTSVLEIATGTGQHTAFFATQFPNATFQPSEADPILLGSIFGYTNTLPNVKPPLLLNVEDTSAWPQETYDAVFNFNMIHISPFSACESLFASARKCLNEQGKLLLYGPFFEDEVETAPSNTAFDRSLKSRNSQWGVRNMRDVKNVAEKNGFHLTHRVEMPANNLSLIFRNQ